MDDVGAYYGGIEPVKDDLTNVREQRTLIPPTQNVRVRVNKVEYMCSKDNNYRWLRVSLRLMEGVDVEGTVKYKGAVIFARDNICYYANPEVYTSDFFKNRQHLVPRAKLSKATGVDLSTIDGHTAEKLENEGKQFLANIVIKTNTYERDGTEITEQINDIDSWRRIKPLPLTDQV